MNVIVLYEERFDHRCAGMDSKYEQLTGSRHSDGAIRWEWESFTQKTSADFCPRCGLDLVSATNAWVPTAKAGEA